MLPDCPCAHPPSTGEDTARHDVSDPCRFSASSRPPPLLLSVQPLCKEHLCHIHQKRIEPSAILRKLLCYWKSHMFIWFTCHSPRPLSILNLLKEEGEYDWPLQNTQNPAGKRIASRGVLLNELFHEIRTYTHVCGGRQRPPCLPQTPSEAETGSGASRPNPESPAVHPGE